jgi:ABC-type sulfate/molybdate transport systems ATPase subunit
MYYDRVLVLDQGRVLEYDTPLALLSKPHSRLRCAVGHRELVCVARRLGVLHDPEECGGDGCN